MRNRARLPYLRSDPGGGGHVRLEAAGFSSDTVHEGGQRFGSEMLSTSSLDGVKLTSPIDEASIPDRPPFYCTVDGRRGMTGDGVIVARSRSLDATNALEHRLDRRSFSGGDDGEEGPTNDDIIR